MKIGVNSFIWIPEDLYAPFDCVRLFSDMDFTQNERGLYTYAPTKKDAAWNYDKTFANLTAQGKSALLVTHKRAKWLGTGKLESKPHEIGANPEDPLSYTIFSQHLYQQQARWGKTVQPLENIKTFTETFYGVYKNEPLTGLGYNVRQMPLNETNADWWTDAEYWTPKQLAAVWSAAYDGHGGQIPLGGIMTADPQAFIVFPSLAYGTRKGLTIREYYVAFILEFEKLRPDLINITPFNAIGINFYCRGKENYIEKGVDPFDSKLHEEFTWWKRNIELPIYLTEFGYDEIKPSKQCPDNYPGMDIMQTKTEMTKRGIYLAAASGVDEFYYYQIRDEVPSDSGLYRTCGLVKDSKHNHEKKAIYFDLDEEILPDFREATVGELVGIRTIAIDDHFVQFNADGTETIITDPIPPPMTHHTLSVINKQLQWSDEQPCNLVHADSPESRLHPNYRAQFSNECKVLPTKGINCITVTLRGDDVTAINPWLNNQPSQGVDVAKLALWATQLKEFLTECEKNNMRGAIIAYLGERTNFKSITDQQYENWFVEMGKAFSEIQGSIIFGWEEIWDGSDSNTMRFCDRIGSLLKSYLPQSLLMYHNNPGQKAFNAGSSFVKIVCIQETSVSAMKATAQSALSKGYAVHFHELYPGFKTTNSQETNRALMKELCDAAMSIGVKNVGCFASDYDLQAPDPSKLGYLYEYQAQLLSGNTPPTEPPTNPNNMLKYSLSPNPFPDSKPLHGATIPSGANLYIYWDGTGKTPFVFQPSGQRENAAPYEYMGGKPVTFPDGNQVVGLSDANGILATANFTVGTTTPPPPTEVKGTGFVKKNGKIEFAFEDGSKLTVTPV